MEGELAGGFGWVDWAVVIGLFALTTAVGERAAGKQASLRDFFLGGRKLPWYAVAASIVATEISAVTFISLPSVVWKPGGNLAYLQIGLIGSLLAKAIIGYVLVPAYYEREIYSPYDYMGARLGGRVRGTATALFTLGGVIGQSARVYVTAVVLEVILQRELGWVAAQAGIPPLVAAVAAIGLVAVAWTWIGGIAIVIWTDAILFVLFLVGIAIALLTAAAHVDGGLLEALRSGADAGKLRILDASLDPTRAYTFWAALIASTWGMVGSYGTDQLVAQRLFTCKGARDARRAILASYAAVIVTCLVALVGVGLWAYYREHPLSGAGLELVSAKPDRVFPVFIVEVIPTGLKGLVLAGAFAAAISSLDSILAALSQTTVSAVWVPWRRRRGRPMGEAESLRVSRSLVVGWALVLCAAAVGIDRVAADYDSILDLALAVASYTGGALIAGFFLAFLPLRIDGRGFSWSAPLSVLTIFAVTSHQEWAATLGLSPPALCLWAGVVGLLLWIALRVRTDRSAGVSSARLAVQTVALAAGFLLTWWIARDLWWPGADGARRVLAWPWYLPLGSVVAFLYGWLLARPRSPESA